MNLEEIAIAFKNCNGDANQSFKDYLIGLSKPPQEYENGLIISKANNYILTDVEKLLSKAIINLCASDLLLKKGYFNWGFVTSYYSSFFSIQALNRLQLNFNTWTNFSIICQNKNYSQQELKLTKVDASKNSHETQFQLFFNNYVVWKNSKGIDRFWNLALQSFEYGGEPKLRNEINYSISNEYYYELNLDKNKFLKIIKDNKNSPFDKNNEAINDPINHSRNHLKISISRIRVISYILNYLANENNEYNSYFQRNMKIRKESIDQRYSNLSVWIKLLLEEWLHFQLIEKDDLIL